jgi:hypothetical protein
VSAPALLANIRLGCICQAKTKTVVYSNLVFNVIVKSFIVRSSCQHFKFKNSLCEKKTILNRKLKKNISNKIALSLSQGRIVAYKRTSVLFLAKLDQFYNTIFVFCTAERGHLMMFYFY